MKIQLSLEFILVFCFVIAIFVILFTIIAYRSSSLFGQQSFAEAQLLAEQIAQQINAAVAGGNGYISNTTLQTGYGLNVFNVTVLNDGAVVVTLRQGVQKIFAVSYSDAKDIFSANVLSNSTLSLQNLFGAVCIDIACPTGQIEAGPALETGTSHAALFNGYTSLITVNSLTDPPSQSATITAWVYAVPNQSTACGSESGSYCKVASLGQGCFGLVMGISAISLTPKVTTNACITTYFSSLGNIEPRTWTFVGMGISSSTLTIDINGRSSSTGGYTPDEALSSLTIGQNFNGSIEDVQVYNSLLSSGSMQSLFDEGLGGAPLPTNTLVGWWPLNGNPFDYSGHGNNAQAYNITYPATGSYSVYLPGASNVLVGFQASGGTMSGYSNSISPLVTTYYPASENNTNATGVARATSFDQSYADGTITLVATPYSGSLGEKENLTGWWPLNLGSGSSAYDLSGRNNTLAATNVIWSKSPYAANFNGANSVISAFSTNGYPSSTTFTLTAWVDPTGFTGSGQCSDGGCVIVSYGDTCPGHPASPALAITSTPNAPTFSSNPTRVGSIVGLLVDTYSQPCDSVAEGSAYLAPQTWNFVAATENNTNVEVYVNGKSDFGYTIPFTMSSFSPSTVEIGDAVGAYSSGTDFNGSITDVQVYNVALTPEQLYQIYLEGIPNATRQNVPTTVITT